MMYTVVEETWLHWRRHLNLGRWNKPALPPWTVTRLILIAVINLFGQLGCIWMVEMAKRTTTQAMSKWLWLHSQRRITSKQTKKWKDPIFLELKSTATPEGDLKGILSSSLWPSCYWPLDSYRLMDHFRYWVFTSNGTVTAPPFA